MAVIPIFHGEILILSAVLRDGVGFSGVMGNLLAGAANLPLRVDPSLRRRMVAGIVSHLGGGPRPREDPHPTRGPRPLEDMHLRKGTHRREGQHPMEGPLPMEEATREVEDEPETLPGMQTRTRW